MQQSPKFKNLKITYSLFFIIICLLLLYLKAFKLYQNSKFTLYDTFTQKSRQTTRISVVKILPFCIPENLSIRRLNGAEQILTALGINHIIIRKDLNDIYMIVKNRFLQRRVLLQISQVDIDIVFEKNLHNFDEIQTGRPVKGRHMK